MLSHKMDFNCCANRDGFRRDSHILKSMEQLATVDREDVYANSLT